jgi:predicted nucleic acid-binding Zn ribbon protein
VKKVFLASLQRREDAMIAWIVVVALVVVGVGLLGGGEDKDHMGRWLF